MVWGKLYLYLNLLLEQPLYSIFLFLGVLVIWFLRKMIEAFFEELISRIFPFLFNKEAKQNKEVNKIMEEEIRKKNKKLKEKDKVLKRANKKLETKNEEILKINRFKGSLKRKGFSTENLVRKYKNELPVVVLAVGRERDPEGEKVKWVLDYFRENYDLLKLTGHLKVIPPSKVPEGIRNKKDLKKWLTSELSEYKNYEAVFSFVAVIDLREIYSEALNLDFDEEKLNYFKTLNSVLDYKDIFDDERFNKLLQDNIISPVDLIKDGDIGFLASASLSTKQLEAIHENQMEIEDELGEPSLVWYSKEDNQKALQETLARFVKEPELASEEIRREANFWKEQIEKLDE